MNDGARQQLCQIIAEYGVSVCEDLRRFEGLLRDFCGEHKLEINVLTKALQERVVDELTHASNSVPVEMLLKGFSKRLQDNWGLSEESASWSVESWALALGRLATSTSQRHTCDSDSFRTNSTTLPELTKLSSSGQAVPAISKTCFSKLALAAFLLLAAVSLIWWLHTGQTSQEVSPLGEVQQDTLDYYNACIQGDRGKILAFYSSNMDTYFTLSRPDRAMIKRDMDIYYSRWKLREAELLQPLKVSLVDERNVAARVEYKYQFISTKGDNYSGISTTDLVWRKHEDSGWRIVSVRETVKRK